MAQDDSRYNEWIDPLSDAERDDLELFCEVTQELEDSPFFKNLLHRGEIKWNVSSTDGVIKKAEILDFNPEQMKAFLLSGRLFLQDNDHFSIANIAKIFDRRVSERTRFWMNFNGTRAGLNEFLDREGNVTELQGKPMTNRELLHAFLFGRYAHRGKKYAPFLSALKKSREATLAAEAHFLLTLSIVFETVRTLRGIIVELLDYNRAAKRR